MKKLILFLFLFLQVTVVFSQPEFLISIEDHLWIDTKSKENAELQITFVIKNIGNQQGRCEDLQNLWLYSSSEVYNSMIHIIDWGSFLFNEIKPNDKITGFITFSVPKDADDLRLKFDEEAGGDSKYICESYNKYISTTKQERSDKYKSEGDSYYNLEDYESAITKYTYGYTYDPSRKKEFYGYIVKCYCKIGDNNLQKFYADNYELYREDALGNYSQALTFDEKNSEAKIKIAKIYKEIGDEKLAAGNKTEALSNYKKAAKYSDTPEIRNKISEIENLQKKAINENREMIRAKEKYERLANPTTGFEFSIGYSATTNSSTGQTLPLINFQINVPSKAAIIPAPAPPFAMLVDFDLGISINASSTLYINRFLNRNDISHYNDLAITQGFFNAGIGGAFLNESITPMVKIFYGIYGQYFNVYLNDELQDKINKELEKIQWGHGYKVELSLLIGKSPGLKLSYFYNNYTILSDIDFLKNRYSSHSLNLGVLNF